MPATAAPRPQLTSTHHGSMLAGPECPKSIEGIGLRHGYLEQGGGAHARGSTESGVHKGGGPAGMVRGQGCGHGQGGGEHPTQLAHLGQRVIQLPAELLRRGHACQRQQRSQVHDREPAARRRRHAPGGQQGQGRQDRAREADFGHQPRAALDHAMQEQCAGDPADHGADRDRARSPRRRASHRLGFICEGVTGGQGIGPLPTVESGWLRQTVRDEFGQRFA